MAKATTSMPNAARHYNVTPIITGYNTPQINGLSQQRTGTNPFGVNRTFEADNGSRITGLGQQETQIIKREFEIINGSQVNGVRQPGIGIKMEQTIVTTTQQRNIGVVDGPSNVPSANTFNRNFEVSQPSTGMCRQTNQAFAGTAYQSSVNLNKAPTGMPYQPYVKNNQASVGSFRQANRKKNQASAGTFRQGNGKKNQTSAGTFRQGNGKKNQASAGTLHQANGKKNQAAAGTFRQANGKKNQAAAGTFRQANGKKNQASAGTSRQTNSNNSTASSTTDVAVASKKKKRNNWYRNNRVRGYDETNASSIIEIGRDRSCDIFFGNGRRVGTGYRKLIIYNYGQMNVHY